MTRQAFVALIYPQRSTVIVIRQICKFMQKYLPNLYNPNKCVLFLPLSEGAGGSLRMSP